MPRSALISLFAAGVFLLFAWHRFVDPTRPIANLCSDTSRPARVRLVAALRLAAIDWLERRHGRRGVIDVAFQQGCLEFSVRGTDGELAAFVELPHDLRDRPAFNARVDDECVIHFAGDIVAYNATRQAELHRASLTWLLLLVGITIGVGGLTKLTSTPKRSLQVHGGQPAPQHEGADKATRHCAVRSLALAAANRATAMDDTEFADELGHIATAGVHDVRDSNEIAQLEAHVARLLHDAEAKFPGFRAHLPAPHGP
jgi:hypothetical protein